MHNNQNPAQQANPEQNQPMDQDDQQDADDMEEDEADNEWPAWNPAIFTADNGPVVPQHPAIPQDHLDVDLSGSSMRFLRGDGPDISLEDVLATNVSDDGSSSSSEATSTQVEDHARFVAAQSCCANVLIFNKNGLQVMFSSEPHLMRDQSSSIGKQYNQHKLQHRKLL